MRGIKECLNWLVDNRGKMIESVTLPKIHHPVHGEIKRRIEFSDDFGNLTIHWVHDGGMVGLRVFDEEEWEEVKQTYTFQEASDICRETGKRFKGEYNDMMNRNPEGEVYVWSLDGGDVVIDCEWTEV